MKILAFLTCFALLITGCTDPVKSDKSDFDFNYSTLLSKELEKLKTSNAIIEKKIYYQGKIETKTIEQPQWEKELRPFMECNIQTPAFDKLYSENKRVSGDSIIYTFKAKTDKPEIRVLEVVVVNRQLGKIEAFLFKKNSYFTLHESLLLRAGDGYRIKGSQKMMLAAETIYRIEAKFKVPS
jgi:hypothetical protein